MSRPRKSSQARPVQTDDAENTPPPPSWSEFESSEAGQLGQLGVEGSFFADGLSEDAVIAASERQREREALHRAASGHANRWVYAVGAVGACVILGFGLAPKRRTPRPAPLAAVASATAALPPPPASEPAAPVAALAPGRTVSVQGLRAGAVPGSPEAACEQLLLGGQFTEIKTTCTRAFEGHPDAVLAVKVARSALERQRYGDAQSWARRAIEIDRQRGEAFLTLGGAEQGLGHGPQARVAYARYLELDPDGPLADNVRALIDEL